MELYDKRTLRMLGVIALAISSSLVSSMIYYENGEFKDNYLHFFIMGTAFIIQMVISSASKSISNNTIMEYSRGLGAMFVWVSVIVFIVVGLFYGDY